MRQLNETLDYGDFKGEVLPAVTVDEYAAKMGKDKDVVTVTFTVKSKQCGKDLCNWLEGGYDYILDASTSTGEVANNKWLVFAEMDRRMNVPEHIVEMLEDLETLTGFKLDDWTVEVDDKEYKPKSETLKNVIILSPKEYKRIKRKEEKEEEDLNGMRDIAGLDRPSDEEEKEKPDAELKEFVMRAGL